MISWVGWSNGGAWIVGAADASASVGTAIGVGALGALLGFRYAAGKWDRVRKAWWADWERMCASVEREFTVRIAFDVSCSVLFVHCLVWSMPLLTGRSKPRVG